MELHQLRYLRSVVRAGSVTRAAELEHVAQPSVSKQLRALERELGVPLFHRVGRRVVPTEAAYRLADCANRVIDDIAATTAAIAGPESAAAGHLRLCATETLSDHLLPPALAALRQRFPHVHVSVEMLGTDDAVARLLDDAADLALVVLPLADSRLDIHSLLQEDVLVALPPGHRWATLPSVALADALREPDLLLSMPGHGLRAQVEREAQARGLSLDSPIELRSQQALLAMVAAGAGITFAPRMSVEHSREVVAKPLEPNLTREVGWVRRKGRHLPPSAPVLIDLLTAGTTLEG